MHRKVKVVAITGKTVLQPEIQPWREALRTDDVSCLKFTLEEATAAEKSFLLDGNIAEGGHGLCTLEIRDKVTVTRSLHFAAVFMSMRAIETLLDHGADPEIAEEDGSNIIHSMIMSISYNVTSRTEKMILVYHKPLEILQPHEVKNLLYSENASGLRPVEFAAQQGCFIFMTEILDTYDAYVIYREYYGVMQYIYCDVTDYETGSRQELSPLTFMEMVDERKLGCPTTNRIFSEGLMAEQSLM